MYTIFLGKQVKMVYTIGPERRVYTIEASDPEKEKKEGFHGGGVYFFLPWISGLPNAKSQRLRYAISQTTTLPTVVALNRNLS